MDFGWETCICMGFGWEARGLIGRHRFRLGGTYLYGFWLGGTGFGWEAQVLVEKHVPVRVLIGRHIPVRVLIGRQIVVLG